MGKRHVIALGLLFCALFGSWAGILFSVVANPAITYTTMGTSTDAEANAPSIADYERYYAYPSPLDIALELTQGRVGLVFRIDFRADFYSFLTNSYNTNIPFIQNGYDAIADVNMPSVGYLDYLGERLDVSVGRRKLKWGPATYDLAISDGAIYMDNVWFDYRFKVGAGDMWFNYVLIGSDRDGTSPSVFTDTDNQLKTFVAHRIGYETDFMRVGLAELNLIHDIAPTIEDIAPLVSFHNLYEDRYSNVMLQTSAEGRVGPLRGYGEFVMDDLVMPWEDDPAPARPTAMGWCYGLEWKIFGGDSFNVGRTREEDYALREVTFARPGGLTLSYEHYRTTTYLYNRETSSGKWTLADHRLVDTYTGYISSDEAFYLGFPYGPDCALDMLRLSYETRRLSTAFSAKFLREGARGIDATYPPSDGRATWYELQEPVTKNLIVGASADWAIMKTLRLWASGDAYIGDTPQISLAVGCTYYWAASSL